MTERKEIARIIDANLNRTKEGIRVLEEVARFLMDNQVLSGTLKSLRHEISRTEKEFGFTRSELLDARDSEKDVGRKIEGALEFDRKSIEDLTIANFSRVTQALRSIEEFGKMHNPEAAAKIKDIRYKFYTLEKKFDLESRKLDVMKLEDAKKKSSDTGCIIFLVIAVIVIILLLIFSQNTDKTQQDSRFDNSTKTGINQSCLRVLT